jgi:hypothetical protein
MERYQMFKQLDSAKKSLVTPQMSALKHKMTHKYQTQGLVPNTIQDAG